MMNAYALGNVNKRTIVVVTNEISAMPYSRNYYIHFANISTETSETRAVFNKKKKKKKKKKKNHSCHCYVEIKLHENILNGLQAVERI